MNKTLIKTKDGELQVVLNPEAYEGAEIIQQNPPEDDWMMVGPDGKLVVDQARKADALETKEAIETGLRSILSRIKANEAEIGKLRANNPRI